MKLDYDSLLQHPRVRAALDPVTLAQAEADDDFFLDLIAENSTTVLTLTWDGGGFAHSGSNTISEWNGFYFVDCDGVEFYGPFDTLEEPLALGEFHYSGTPKPEVDSTVPLAKLLELAEDLADVEDKAILIDGVVYRRVNGLLVEQRPN